MRKLFTCTLLLLKLFSVAQTIPANRIFNWRHSGHEGTIPSPTQIIDITSFGGVGDNVTDNSVFLQNAIASSPGAKVIFFPAGNFVFNSSINLDDSIVMRGSSSDSSKLIFDFAGAIGNGINIIGTVGSFVNVISGAERYNNFVTVSDPSSFSVSDFAEIQETNGTWDTQPISWADNSVGQMMKISRINSDTLFFDEQIRINYDYSLTPIVRKIIPKREIGIECLKISRRDSVHVGVCFNINLSHATNCWIKGNEIATSIGSHIEVDASTNITIKNNFIHHNFEYDGTSTHGYGITLFGHTGQCRIENNIMQHLRHSFSLQCGANGNVIAYNYSSDPNRSEFPADFGADISMHGHYTYSNLFEGNIVQNIQIDQTWGPTGPFNTFFRNRAELYGIFMTSGAAQSDSLNFVGNEVTNTGLFMGMYTLAGSNHFEFGNNIKGTITPSGTTPLPDTSYYLDSLPTFWTSNLFPTIGIPNAISSGTIPAKSRFQSGVGLAYCEEAINTTIHEQNDQLQLQIFPNPFHDQLTIYLPSEINKEITISIIDLQGRIVFTISHQLRSGQNEIQIPTQNILQGIYIISIDGKRKILMQE